MDRNSNHDATSATEHTRMALLVDGECPLCRREAALLSALDKRGRLHLIDISDSRFDASSYGLTQAEVMGHIHGILPDGRVVTGVEAFIGAYEAAGLGWLAAALRTQPLRWLAERGYAWFARNRLWLTGRGDQAACDTGRCAVPSTEPPDHSRPASAS